MTDDTAPHAALHPAVLRAFQSHFDSDLVDWQVPDFLTMQASFVATEIASSDADLETILVDVERLRTGDRAAAAALDQACGWCWDEASTTRAALQRIVAEIARALEFRIHAKARDA